MNRLYDELDNEFEAKLRHYAIESQRARLREGEAVFKEGIAYIDALFNLKIFDKLHEPSLIGIKRITSGGGDIYILFEALGVRPKHYESASLTPDVPPVLKWDYLDRIKESWVEGGENWMEVIAVHTGYILKIEDNKFLFKKSNLGPLTGSEAHIMSKDVIREMVCIENGSTLGILKGYNIPLQVDIYSIYKYHTGIFGFTGSGKSNLVSLLVRKVLEKFSEIKVLIFDIAGEYSVHLLDLLLNRNGVIYTTESLTKERFLESQVIPESLLENIDEDKIRSELAKANYLPILIRKKRLTLDVLINILNRAVDTKPVVVGLVNKAMKIIRKYPPNYPFIELLTRNKDDAEELIALLRELRDNFSQRSYLYSDLNVLSEGGYIEVEEDTLSIPEIAYRSVMDPNHEDISIFYIPDPTQARMAIAEFINMMFRVKKTYGIGNKLLIIMDEAQEFIPDRTRSEDYTHQSNISVEALLRQGRKYSAAAWIATQRLAHLNTNALQQLHSYFVSTLPRTYDRNVVSDAFSISRSVIDKSTELDVGEWIFVSYKATKLKNVPVEVKAENNEDYLIKYFNNKKS
jgi:hypothetical protein